MDESGRGVLRRWQRRLARLRAAAAEQRRRNELAADRSRRTGSRNSRAEARWAIGVSRGLGPDRPRERSMADLGQRLGVAVDVAQYNAFAAEYRDLHPGATWMQTKREYLRGRLVAAAGGVVTEELRVEVAERVAEAMYGPEVPVGAPVGPVVCERPRPPGGGGPAVLLRPGTFPHAARMTGVGAAGSAGSAGAGEGSEATTPSKLSDGDDGL